MADPAFSSPDAYWRPGSDSALRSTNEKLGDVLSARDTVGVTGTQGTNQGAAINKAIAAAAASSSYATIYFPDGVYDIETPIVPLQGVTLKLAHNATMRCVASMPAMVQTPSSYCLFDGKIEGAAGFATTMRTEVLTFSGASASRSTQYSSTGSGTSVSAPALLEPPTVALKLSFSTSTRSGRQVLLPARRRQSTSGRLLTRPS